MNKFGRLLVAGAVALALSACADRDDSLDIDGQDRFGQNGQVEGEPGLGGAFAGTVDVRVSSTPRSVVTGSPDAIEIGVRVVDLDNRSVANQAVTFGSSGGVLSGLSAETDENGRATATLELVDDFRNQDITVTASAGGSTGETVVRSDGTTIQVGGPNRVTRGADATLELALTSGTSEPIRGETIAIEVLDGTLGVPGEALTGTDGTVSIDVSNVTADAEIRLTALEGTVVATHSLEALAPGAEPGLGAAAGVGTLDVRVQSERQRLITGSADPAANSTTITAFVVDLDNRAIANQPLEFGSSGGVLQNVSTETDANGVATATLRLLDDYRSQDIVVRVTAEGYEGRTIVRADGSGFAVEGPTKVIAGNAAELAVTLESGAGTPIVGETVSLTSVAGNTLSPASATTDADGRLDVRVGSAAGSDTIRLSALDGTVVGTHELEVLTDSLAFAGIAPDARLLVGLEHDLEVTWTRQGQPVVNRALSFATTTGRVLGSSTVTTDAAGRASVQIASDVPGAAVLTVADALDGEPTETLEFEFTPALDVRVLSDVNRIETGGSDVANITALVTDVDNKSVANKAVRFSATGGVLQGVSGETDENGVAGATLKLLQDFRTQDIVVTVTADDFSGTVSISADGSELEVTGPSSLVEGADAELVIVLSAGNGEPISNERVELESLAGNRVVPAVGVTDANGRIDARVEIVSGAAEDTIRMLALGDTVTATHSFDVSTDSLAFDSSEGTEIPVGTSDVGPANDVSVTWTSFGSPVAGRDLRFSTTAGRIVGSSTVTTDAAGKATVRLSSASAGTARITVEDAINGSPSAQADVEFVATTPSRVAIDASSSRVPVQGTSTITAFVTDPDGNPVKGRQVVFGSGDLKGGRLSPSSATSGSDGEASVTFTAGTDATTFEEIELVAQVQDTDIVDSMRLTVVERVLNVTIGTSNDVEIQAFGTQYAMPFVVQVADGGGTPLENAEVSMSIRPINYGVYGSVVHSLPGRNAKGEDVIEAAYGKGWMTLVDENGFEQYEGDADWAADHWELSNFALGCESEDRNLNRLLDINEDANDNGVEDAGEDANGDGFEPREDLNANGSLDPQDPASLGAVSDPSFATLSGGTLSTDANGSGYFRMIYPASNALWAWVEITARAEALGAEAEDSFRTILLLPASEAGDKDSPPANVNSPYGVDVGQDGCGNDR